MPSKGERALQSALRAQITRAVEYLTENRDLAVITSVDPLVAQMGDETLVEGEDLVLSQSLRRYREEVGFEKDDTLVVGPLPDGDYLAESVLADGPAVPPSDPTDSDKHYTFSQLAPAYVWTIPHALGKVPSVYIELTDGTGGVEADMHIVDLDTITLTFSFLVNGTAYLN